MSKLELAREVGNEIRFNQNLGDLFDELVSNALGINRTDHRCIDILEQRGPLPAGTLANLARLSPGAVTSVIDRLEQRGFVERFNDPDDRRKRLVRVTPQLYKEMQPFYGPLTKLFIGQLASLTTAQLEFLRDFYTDSRAQYEAHIEKIRKKYGD